MIHFCVLCDSSISSVSVIPIVALLVDYEMHLTVTERCSASPSCEVTLPIAFVQNSAVNLSYSQVDSGPGPSLGAPQLPLVGSQEEGGRGDEEQQQQHSLPGSTAQRQQGHAAVPGGRQAGESDPVEEEHNNKRVTQINQDIYSSPPVKISRIEAVISLLPCHKKSTSAKMQDVTVVTSWCLQSG